jgi:uncharacterized protein
MSTQATTVGRFVWHEQVSSDPARAREFYTQLFGWGTEDIQGPMPYQMISIDGKRHGGFGQAQEGAPPPHWLSHVLVESVDDTAQKAKDAGGTIAAGPFDMGEYGRMAIIGDPQGAYVSAYQSAGEGEVPAGVFVWDELATTDADAAQRFYEAVFGWTTKDMGEQYGGYRIFHAGADENGVAGFMATDQAPPHWQPYVAVEDVDVTTARTKELGGSVLAEPMDVPEVGRLAVLVDPQGATFGVIKTAPMP